MNLKELLEKDPQLRQRWAVDLNTLQPEQLNPRSHKKAWWRCEQGHTWQAAVGSVAAEGCGCPYCAGKKAVPGVNDLRTLHPDLAAQWHPTRNGTNTPETTLPGSHEAAWWRCDMGHSWQAMVFSRTGPKQSGCPYCTGRKVWPGFNDLCTLYPEVAAQWDPTRNGTLNPSGLSPGSNKKIWWRCDEGHVWQAAVYSRTRKRAAGCPACAAAGRTKKYPRISFPPRPSAAFPAAISAEDP